MTNYTRTRSIHPTHRTSAGEEEHPSLRREAPRARRYRHTLAPPRQARTTVLLIETANQHFVTQAQTQFQHTRMYPARTARFSPRSLSSTIVLITAQPTVRSPLHHRAQHTAHSPHTHITPLNANSTRTHRTPKAAHSRTHHSPATRCSLLTAHRFRARSTQPNAGLHIHRGPPPTV